jgi:hypothetical protein
VTVLTPPRCAAAAAAAAAPQVREVRLHFSAATGPCAARSLAQQLWVGEEYVLQVDAHMRFVQVRVGCGHLGVGMPC